MNLKALKRADTKSLIEQYRKAAARHGEASVEGDYKTANRQYEIISAIFSEIRERSPDAQRSLLELLDDANPNVRLWAASHALEVAPGEGVRVLRELAALGRPPRLEAEMTLKEWEEGRLRFQ